MRKEAAENKQSVARERNVIDCETCTLLGEKEPLTHSSLCRLQVLAGVHGVVFKVRRASAAFVEHGGIRIVDIHGFAIA